MTIQEIINDHKKGRCCCVNLLAQKRVCAGAKYLSGKISEKEAVAIAESEKELQKKEQGFALMQAYEMLPYSSDDTLLKPFFYYKAGTPLWVVKKGIEKVFNIKEEDISDYYINPFIYLAKRYFGMTRLYCKNGEYSNFGKKAVMQLLSIVWSCYQLTDVPIDEKALKAKLDYKGEMILWTDSETILQNWTAKPFDKRADFLTKEGREAYDELVSLLYDFANLYGYSDTIENVVERIDSIVDDDYCGCY